MVEAGADIIEAPEKCTMRRVQSAERHVRFPSSPMVPGPCTVVIVTRSISLLGHRNDTKLNLIAFRNQIRAPNKRYILQGGNRPCETIL